MSRGWKIGLAIIVAVIIVGSAYYGITTYYNSLSSGKGITIYVYKDFMAWGPNGSKELPHLIGIFENETGINVKVQYFSGARDELLALMKAPQSERPDVVVGLDNILVYEGASKGLFVKLPRDILSMVPENLQKAFNPKGYGVPIDYGLIAVVVDESRINVTSLSLEDFVKNASLASKLVIEDPAHSTTGLSFLLWQYSYYTYVLHQNWTSWWKSVKKEIKIVKSWGDAWDVFSNKKDNRPILVSYGTDPAYDSYSHKNGNTSYRAFICTHDGKRYGWVQIEGAAIVNGTKHLKYAEDFLKFLLSPEFQKRVPLDNWMYPVINVTLPRCYKYATSPKGIIILNTYIPPEKMAELQQELLTEWLKVMG